jgi:heparosan-N-sulfate-glucuronate 5-epimerase
MAGRGVLDLAEYALGTKRYQPCAGWNTDSMHYPVDLAFTLRNDSRYYQPKDADGLPMRTYASAGDQYSPSRITAWSLAHWNRLQDGEAASRDAVLQGADWLASFNDGRFVYRFDWGRIRAPWISCLAQGEAISVLVRAASLTGDEEHVALAQRAMEPMTLGLDAHGVQDAIDGDVFLEEYPDGDAPHVLNGCLYAMVGLIDLHRFDGSADAADLLDGLSATLERHIMRWDLNGWSAYDLAHERDGGVANACTPAYQSLHATLLECIAVDRDLPTCRAVADRWRRSLSNPLTRCRALAGKIRYRRRHPAPS